jgi:hypothetical protein
MFSTILKEVTGYFDRRALLSAFFPSLIFWGLTLATFTVVTQGRDVSLARWEAQSATLTALILVAFLVWVAFWSFLTLNFRPALTRLFEGNWHIPRLEEWRRKRWQERFSHEDKCDGEMEQQEIFAEELRESFKGIRTQTKDMLPPDLGPGELTFDQYLANADAALSDTKIPASRDLESYAQTARIFQAQFTPTETPVPQDSSWSGRRAILGKLIRRLNKITPELAEKREQFKRNFSLYFPPDLYDVMPTRLGNILKTAEVRVWKRYRIDVVTIWSRLQSDLPKEFADTLQDAKMSLDLMLTLSAFVFFFGAVIASLLAYRLPSDAFASAPLILTAVVPLVGRYAFRLGKSATIYVTLASLVFLIILPPFAISLVLSRGFPAPLVWFGDAALRFEFFLTLLVGIILLSWLIYQNATQAALSYAERIQSAFDLYRWKVFEGFNLQLPPSLEEERVMWKEVCALLSSSKTPSPNYFAYVKQEKTKPQAPPPPTKIKLPVLAKTKSAYELIADVDIIEEDIVESDVTPDAARTRQELVGKRPLQQIAARQPVRRSLVTDSRNLEHTVSVGISATPAAVMGGDLQVGDVIDVIFVPAATAANKVPEPVVFDNVRVLNVKPITGSPNYIVSIALPANRRIKFASLSFGSDLLIARRTFL